MAQRVRALTWALLPASSFSTSALLPLCAGVAPNAYECARHKPPLMPGHHGRADLPLPWPGQELWLQGRPGRAEGLPLLAAALHSSPSPGTPQPGAGRGDPGAGPPLGQHQEGGSGSAPPLASSASSGSSWLGRVQSLMWGRGQGGGSEQDQWSLAAALDAFAKQLGQARTFGSLASFGRGLPRGGEAAVTASLKQQQDIALALASLLRPSAGSGTNLQLAPDGSVPAIPAPLKEAAAVQVGCAVADVNNFLVKFSWFCQAQAKMEALRAQGKPVPRTFKEVEELMGGSWTRTTGGTQGAAPSRNAACPCGSGKKFKRCCGAAAAA